MFARSMSGPRGADVSFSASQNGLSGAPNDSQSMASNSFSAPEMFMKPMNQWMTEEPWNHITGRKDALAHVNNFRIGNTRPHVPAFSYQASIAPSECETTGFRPLPSDSGYESVDRTHHGFPSGSTYGDRQIETASVLSSHIEHQFDRPAIPGWSVRPGVIQSTQANNPVEGNALICQFCNEKVKTKSEIKLVEPLLPFLLALADTMPAGSTNNDTRNPITVMSQAVPAPRASVPRTMSTDTRKVVTPSTSPMPNSTDAQFKAVATRTRNGRGQTTLNST